MRSKDLAEPCQAELSALGFLPIKPHIHGRCTRGVVQTVHFNYTKTDSYLWFSSVFLAEPNLSLNRGVPGACGRVPSKDEALAHRDSADDDLVAAIRGGLVSFVLPELERLNSAAALRACLDKQSSAYARYVKAFGAFQDGEIAEGRASLAAFLADPRLHPRPGVTLLIHEQRHSEEMLRQTDEEVLASTRAIMEANVRRNRLSRLLAHSAAGA